MKNQIIKELEYFNGIVFHEKQHYYTLNDYKFGTSVTSLIETYAQEFDSDTISKKIAEKEGITQQDVLDKWKKENEFSCVKGSHIHLKAQGLWTGNDYELNYDIISDSIDKNRLKEEYDIMTKQALNFYNDYKDIYDMIQDEFIVWSKDYDIAGSIDGLMYNKQTQECCILDFKSNKELQFENKYHKKMKVPLQNLDDVNGLHYYLQLSIYKYLIEKYTNIKIKKLFIVYFNINAKNYKIINIPYLKSEVERILNLRKKERDMGKCIPILIIGKSGSGKSTSLRNLKKEEYSLVNVLNKDLPFRNGRDIKGLATKDYEQVKNFIAKTPKNIVVVDDFGYIMTDKFVSKATETGYTKFSVIAQEFYNFIEYIKGLDGDKRVYLMMHEEKSEAGDIAPKTCGKMLDNQICVEGLFSILLRCVFDGKEHRFKTTTDGLDVCKTPIDMFDSEYIDNDLKYVDDKICEYYDIKNEIKEEKKVEEK